MNNNSISRIFISALTGLLQNVFKIVIIVFSWTMKLFGLVFTKIAESTERIITKRSSI